MAFSSTSSLPVMMKQTKPDAERTLLNAVEDRYGGVKVDVEDSMDCNDYVSLLRDSITQWRKQVNRAEDLLENSSGSERLRYAGTMIVLLQNKSS